MDDPTKPFNFIVTGGFHVRNDLKPEVSRMGNLTKFRLADGRAVQLIVALEIEIDDGMSYEYITSEKEMHDLGLEALDYDQLEFLEIIGD